MERADLLQKNASIFQVQGRALNARAKGSGTHVVVVGNPANTNALITSQNAPNIPPENISAMMRLVCYLFIFLNFFFFLLVSFFFLLFFLLLFCFRRIFLCILYRTSRFFFFLVVCFLFISFFLFSPFVFF